MLRNNYDRSTDLINHFLLTEHKELSTETVIKYKRFNILKYLIYLNIINIKPK